MKFGKPRNVGQRIVAATLTFAIRRARPGQLELVRDAFDKNYADAPEQWRRDTWAIAAEKAAKVAKGDVPRGAS